MLTFVALFFVVATARAVDPCRQMTDRQSCSNHNDCCPKMDPTGNFVECNTCPCGHYSLNTCPASPRCCRNDNSALGPPCQTCDEHQCRQMSPCNTDLCCNVQMNGQNTCEPMPAGGCPSHDPNGCGDMPASDCDTTKCCRVEDPVGSAQCGPMPASGCPGNGGDPNDPNGCGQMTGSSCDTTKCCSLNDNNGNTQCAPKPPSNDCNDPCPATLSESDCTDPCVFDTTKGECRHRRCEDAKDALDCENNYSEHCCVKDGVCVAQTQCATTNFDCKTLGAADCAANSRCCKQEHSDNTFSCKAAGSCETPCERQALDQCDTNHCCRREKPDGSGHMCRPKIECLCEGKTADVCRQSTDCCFAESLDGQGICKPHGQCQTGVSCKDLANDPDKCKARSDCCHTTDGACVAHGSADCDTTTDRPCHELPESDCDSNRCCLTDVGKCHPRDSTECGGAQQHCADFAISECPSDCCKDDTDTKCMECPPEPCSSFSATDGCPALRCCPTDDGKCTDDRTLCAERKCGDFDVQHCPRDKCCPDANGACVDLSTDSCREPPTACKDRSKDECANDDRCCFGASATHFGCNDAGTCEVECNQVGLTKCGDRTDCCLHEIDGVRKCRPYNSAGECAAEHGCELALFEDRCPKPHCTWNHHCVSTTPDEPPVKPDPEPTQSECEKTPYAERVRRICRERGRDAVFDTDRCVGRCAADGSAVLCDSSPYYTLHKAACVARYGDNAEYHFRVNLVACEVHCVHSDVPKCEETESYKRQRDACEAKNGPNFLSVFSCNDACECRCPDYCGDLDVVMDEREKCMLRKEANEDVDLVCETDSCLSCTCMEGGHGLCYQRHHNVEADCKKRNEEIGSDVYHVVERPGDYCTHYACVRKLADKVECDKEPRAAADGDCEAGETGRWNRCGILTCIPSETEDCATRKANAFKKCDELGLLLHGGETPEGKCVYYCSPPEVDICPSDLLADFEAALKNSDKCYQAFCDKEKCICGCRAKFECPKNADGDALTKEECLAYFRRHFEKRGIKSDLEYKDGAVMGSASASAAADSELALQNYDGALEELQAEGVQAQQVDDGNNFVVSESGAVANSIAAAAAAVACAVAI